MVNGKNSYYTQQVQIKKQHKINKKQLIMEILINQKKKQPQNTNGDEV